MNKNNRLSLLLLGFLSLPSLAYAYTDASVMNWTQSLLIDTFDTNYRETPAEVYAVQKKYSHAAWVPMNDFFNQELSIIRAHKLVLHPRPLSQPTLVDKGDYLGADSWRVKQSLNVPELQMIIEYSALVIQVKDPKGGPFLVQSIDVKVHHY
jgi:hypothetical protein